MGGEENMKVVSINLNMGEAVRALGGFVKV